MSKPPVTVNNAPNAAPAAIMGIVAVTTVTTVAIAAMFLTVVLVTVVAIVGLVVFGVRSSQRFTLDRELALHAWREQRPPSYVANGAGVWPDPPPARALVHSWRQQHPRPRGQLMLGVMQLLLRK